MGIFRQFLLIIPIFCLLGCQEGSKVPEGSQADYIFKLRPEAMQILIDALEDTPQIRAKAIEIAVSTGRVELSSKIKKLLTDDYVPVRFAAATAVGDLGYTAAKPILYELLKKDTDENAKLAYCYGLYKLGDTKKLDFIKAGLNSSDEKIRANSALLLGKSGEKAVLGDLYRVMTDKNSSDRVSLQAAISIAKLGDEEIYPKIWTMLISVFADDRVLGIEAMGNLGTAEAKNSLITMLDDPVIDVRLAVAAELGKLGETSGESVVIEAFKEVLSSDMPSEDAQRTKIQAAFAISNICTSRTISYLPKLLKDDSELVRLSAANAVLSCMSKFTPD